MHWQQQNKPDDHDEPNQQDKPEQKDKPDQSQRERGKHAQGALGHVKTLARALLHIDSLAGNTASSGATRSEHKQGKHGGTM